MFSRFLKKITKGKKYLDYASITPIDQRVLGVMEEVSRESFYNPGSLYGSGVKAAKILSRSREKVAELFSGRSKNSVHPDEIIFTSGGTESNNIVVQGVVSAWYEKNSNIPHIIISEFEHPSVRVIVEALEKKNKITASKIKIDAEGVVDLKDLKEKLLEHKNTILVSIMLVNNEIGTIQPMRDIASLVRKVKEGSYPLLHTDACQAVNYLDMQFDKMGVDLLSIDGGKCYGPHSSGMLYIKRNTPVQAVYFGGDQEFGMRPGTENLPAIVGIVKALEIAIADRGKETERISLLQKYIFDEVKKMKNISINGSLENRIVNNINICFKDKDSEFLLFKLS